MTKKFTLKLPSKQNPINRICLGRPCVRTLIVKFIQEKSFYFCCDHLIHKVFNKCVYSAHIHTNALILHTMIVNLVQWTYFYSLYMFIVDQLVCCSCAQWNMWERLCAHTRSKHPIWYELSPPYAQKARGFSYGLTEREYNLLEVKTISKPVLQGIFVTIGHYCICRCSYSFRAVLWILFGLLVLILLLFTKLYIVSFFCCMCVM